MYKQQNGDFRRFISNWVNLTIIALKSHTKQISQSESIIKADLRFPFQRSAFIFIGVIEIGRFSFCPFGAADLYVAAWRSPEPFSL